MSRKSKRELERDVENLTEDDDPGETNTFILNVAHFGHREKKWPDMEDSPHPELTIQPHPEKKPKSLSLATPVLLAEPYCNEAVLTVTTCNKKGKYTPEDSPEENTAVAACELWNALDEDELEREKAIREEEGKPIPDFLAEY